MVVVIYENGDDTAVENETVDDGSRSQNTSTNLQWKSFNFYSSSCMFLSCNLCMFFEFIFVDLQIVIPGCLYQLPNKLE